MTHHSPINESIRLTVMSEPSLEIKTALATFCRRNGYPQLYHELLAPLLERADLVLALAMTERPWPPSGIGSQTVEAVGIAMIGTEDRAHLTPVLTDRQHATNIGLVGAVTKQLLEALGGRASSVGYLVRTGDRAVERALEQAGFSKADLLSATDYAEYVEFSAAPDRALQTLGLGDARVGDLLTLSVDAGQLDRLSMYHFALAAGVSGFLADSLRFAALLPGLIDLIASLPPGGVPPGTPGPKFGPEIDVEIEVEQ
jgi:hypothetical protein